MESSTTNQANLDKPTKEVSVMAWIENQFGDVLLLKQKRGNQLWTLPGGKVGRREGLLDAVRREVLEETGLKITSLMLRGVFDRSDKGVITFLYRAQIKGHNDTIYPSVREIETAKFSASIPKNSTPSLIHFWKHLREPSGEPNCPG